MSLRSTQFLDPNYDDIDCETITAITTTTQNLIVTGTITYPNDSSGNADTSGNLSVENLNCASLHVSGNAVVNGKLTTGSIDCSGSLIVYNNVQLGTGEIGVGDTLIANPFLYMSYNCGGVAPQVDAGGMPQMYGCITRNYQVGNAKVDFWNIADGYNNGSSPAFNFYKINNSSAPLVTITNNGQVNCPTLNTSTLSATNETITNSSMQSLTVNQNNQGGLVLYGGTTTYNSSTLAYNSLFGSNLDWLGYYLSTQLPSSLQVGNSQNFSTYTNIFTFSSLPIGVYMCTGSIRLYAGSGSTILGSIVQALQNNNTAIIPYYWNDNFTNGSTLTQNLNEILPINFMFYNNVNSGSIVLQIGASYTGTYEVLAPDTTYLQLV